VVTSVSLRERKKEATRQALHEAVLHLAMAKGLDAVTVDAIADRANVSRRTFSNYFANKEEALLYGDQVRTERLLHELRNRPAAEPPWEALTQAVRTQFAEMDELDPRWLAQLRLLRRHPAVLARQVASHVALEQELATEIANRCPPGTDPLCPRLLAAVFLTTLRTAIGVWSEHPDRATLGSTVNEALRTVAPST
jgi:AcrR family transcriptional regulator